MDYVKYFTKRIGTYELPKMTLRQHFGFWGSKIAYLIIFIAIPIYTLGFFNFIIGYVIYLATTGLVVSVVFQLAHTVESTDFPETENNKLASDWATHQIKTTANFAPNNRIVSWFVGGLNYQIEHHLFPHISHIHYPKIRPIIKNICQKYDIKYQEYPSVVQAVVSHVRYLKMMGAPN
jgi:linoleoyl-CoA desaturase